MEKPISVTINDVKQDVVKIINASGLHPTILQLIFKDICSDINSLAMECLHKEKTEYANGQLISIITI